MQDKYIATKIPLTRSQYSVSQFSDIALAMVMSVTEQKFACSAANDGSSILYLNNALENKVLKRGSEEWLGNVYGNIVDHLVDTASFTKCMTFKSLISTTGTPSPTNVSLSVTPILRQIVLQQISGVLLSKDCELLPPPQLLLNDLYRFMGLQSTNDFVMESNLRVIIASLSNDKEQYSTEDHHDHDRMKRSVSIKKSLSSLSRSRRAIASTINCLPLDNIYDIFNYNKTTGLNLRQFINIVPILLQQSISDDCKPTTKNYVKLPTLTERYGWGTLSVAIICLCSIFGLVLVPLGNKEYFQLFIVFFVALGVGTLVGDAVLHLIPECMGLHVDDPKVIWKLIGSLMSLLAMFIMENMLSLCKKKKDTHDKGTHDGHSHMPNFEDLQKSTIMTEEKYVNDLETEVVKVPISAAIMVILGDGIHNFADGLALGAAFTSSVQKGISTSIAIFCHELPHEFGDFAILLASGFKWKWALAANLMSSLTAFIGLYVGIAISSESPLTQQIIFAITAGMFLYVALTDMVNFVFLLLLMQCSIKLPSLIQLSKHSRAKMFVLEVIGIAIGMTTMALLSFFEEF